MPVYTCPRCQEPLGRTQTPQGVAFPCEACGGHATMIDPLRRALSPSRFRELWSAIKRSPTGPLRCAVCQQGMRAARLGALEVDACIHCEMIWLDAGEGEALDRPADAPFAPAGPPTPPPLPEPQTDQLPAGTYRMLFPHHKDGLLSTIFEPAMRRVVDEKGREIAEIRRVLSSRWFYHVRVCGRLVRVEGVRGLDIVSRNEIGIEGTVVPYSASLPVLPGTSWIFRRHEQLDLKYTSMLRMRQALIDGSRCLAEFSGLTTVTMKTRVPLDADLLVIALCLNWGISSPGGGQSEWGDGTGPGPFE